MIANGIFMSKLIYVIPLWAGCENYLINALQVVQNSAARAVTKCNWRTSIKSMLSQWKSRSSDIIKQASAPTGRLSQSNNTVQNSSE